MLRSKRKKTPFSLDFHLIEDQRIYPYNYHVRFLLLLNSVEEKFNAQKSEGEKFEKAIEKEKKAENEYIERKKGGGENGVPKIIFGNGSQKIWNGSQKLGTVPKNWERFPKKRS